MILVWMLLQFFLQKIDLTSYYELLRVINMDTEFEKRFCFIFFTLQGLLYFEGHF